MRRLAASEAHACAEAMAGVLIDCGAGIVVSFMRPLLPHKAIAFWRGVTGGDAERLYARAGSGTDPITAAGTGM